MIRHLRDKLWVDDRNDQPMFLPLSKFMHQAALVWAYTYFNPAIEEIR